MLIAREIASVLATGDTMEKKQVNIRLPKLLAQNYKEHALQLGVHQNSLYTIALYEYLSVRGITSGSQRKDRAGNIC